MTKRLFLSKIYGFLTALQRDHARFDRLRAQLGVHTNPSLSPKNGTQSLKTIDIDLEQLRKDCWMGIPHKLRPTIWRILLVNWFSLFCFSFQFLFDRIVYFCIFIVPFTLALLFRIL